MQKLLPTSLYSWSFAEPSKTYTGREIFQYMNGAGEVYLAYGFRRLLVQRYACPEQEEILVEVFDMGFPRNAYGALTNLSGYGTPVEIGQGGEYKGGLLAFWKGRYFVCVIIDRENEEARKAVYQMAAIISEAIREEGAPPEILRYLPEDEYAPETLKYFYRNEILNIHFFVADRNLFHLSDKTDAVLVRMKSTKSYLLLIRYSEADESTAAFGDFTTRYMPESRGSGIIQTENMKWTACRRHRDMLAVVFDAPTRADAETILDTVQRRLR
jgi:hypothetical protein